MSNTTEVIKYLREKSSNGFDSITYLGAEQCFVGALRGSNVHNLEEQLVIGADTYTQIYTDENNNKIIEREFHSEEITDGYYKVVSTIYRQENSNNQEYFFRDDEVYLSNNGGLLYFNDDTSALVGDDPNMYGVVNNAFTIFPTNFVVVREDALYFVNSTDTVHILTKVTSKKYISDNGAREIIKESIIRS